MTHFKLICVDGTYTGTLNGNIFVSNTLTESDVKVLLNNPSEDEIIRIFNPKLREIVEHNNKLDIIESTLIESGLFRVDNTIKGTQYYREGIPYTVPELLLDKYYKCIINRDDYTSLDNFWTKVSLNPSPDTREHLFWFLNKWGFTITTSGYFVAYRNVNVKENGNKFLHDFIATKYTQVKSWKKSPKHYTVYQNREDNTVYSAHVAKPYDNLSIKIGNLQELYNNLASYSGTVYTDNRTRTFNIQIGIPVKMKREDCDASQATCSSGLHVAGADWLKNGAFGEESIMALVNPMNVISIPVDDSYGKIRTCEYLPYGVVETDENGSIIPIDTELFEEEYDDYSVAELNSLLAELNENNAKVYSLSKDAMPMDVYNSIDVYRKILEQKQVFNVYSNDEMERFEDDEDDFIREIFNEDDWVNVHWEDNID